MDYTSFLRNDLYLKYMGPRLKDQYIIDCKRLPNTSKQCTSVYRVVIVYIEFDSYQCIQSLTPGLLEIVNFKKVDVKSLLYY